jgi:predicted metalloprotease with PDZ domain
VTSTTASIPGPVARSLLKVCAAVFLMLMAAYSAAIIYCMRHPFPTADLGATYAYEDAERAVRIDMTVSAGAADRAGLRTGDRIVSVNGVPLATPYPFWNALEQGRPTDTVRLGVQRGGARAPATCTSGSTRPSNCRPASAGRCSLPRM